jgi:hypothetical protein
MLECEKDPGWQFLRHSREKLLEFQSKPYDSKKNFWVPDAGSRRKDPPTNYPIELISFSRAFFIYIIKHACSEK